MPTRKKPAAKQRGGAKKRAAPKGPARVRRRTVDEIVAELSAIGFDAEVDANVRVRALAKAAELAGGKGAGVGSKPGKKEQAAAAAATAGAGTEWGDDLNVEAAGRAN